MLAAYPAFTAAEKADAVQTLAGRPASAAALLKAVASGAVPKADVTAFTARQVLALNDPAVTATLTKVWGEVRPASATRATQAAKLRALLTPNTAGRGRPEERPPAVRGQLRELPQAVRRGPGGRPGADRVAAGEPRYVLENVLDPNAVVPFDYKMTAFYLTDGRVVTGLIKAETAQAVTVRTVNDTVVVAKADLEDRKPTNNSVMPEGYSTR